MATARYAAVGGFILGGLGLAVVAVLLFGGAQLFKPSTRAVIHFEGSVAGLDVGAPVTFRGVRVGAVQSTTIHLSSGGRAWIAVQVELEPEHVVIDVPDRRRGESEIEALVAAGLRAQLALQSFVTGQLRVDLNFHPDAPVEPTAGEAGGGPRIPSLPSDLERLRNKLADVPVQELTETALGALAAVDRLAGHLDGELGPLLHAARHGVDGIARAAETAGQAAVRLQEDASRSLRQLDGLAADARHQLDDRGAELARVLGAAELAGRRAQALLAAFQTLSAPRSPLRTDLEAAVRDLAASAGSLRGFAQTIERDPSAVLRGRSAR